MLRWGAFLFLLLTYKVEYFHNTSCFCSHPTLWRPEYGSYMIEGTPGQPYGGTMSEFNTVEGNMGKRRREASLVLNQNETLCTITAFPRYTRLILNLFLFFFSNCIYWSKVLHFYTMLHAFWFWFDFVGLHLTASVAETFPVLTFSLCLCVFWFFV